jgi:hypothetical protein
MPPQHSAAPVEVLVASRSISRPAATSTLEYADALQAIDIAGAPVKTSAEDGCSACSCKQPA